MKRLLKFTIIMASCALLAACNSTGTDLGVGTSSPLSNKINNSKVGGFRYNSSTKEYICGPSTGCKSIQKAYYSSKSVTKRELSGFKMLANTPESSRGAISRGFTQASFGLGGKTKLDGTPQKINIAGRKGIAFLIKSLDKGKPYAYVILIPGNTSLHHFVGVAISKSNAKSAGLKIANAWQPY